MVEKFNPINPEFPDNIKLNLTELQKTIPDRVQFVRKGFNCEFAKISITGIDEVRVNDCTLSAIDITNQPIAFKGKRVTNYLQSIAKGKDWDYFFSSLYYYLTKKDKKLNIYHIVKK